MLLKKFVIKNSGTRAVEDELNGDLDLEFMVSKIKNNLNAENITKLIGFDKATLYKASKYIGDNNKDINVNQELDLVNSRVEQLDSQISTVMYEFDGFMKMVFGGGETEKELKEEE